MRKQIYFLSLLLILTANQSMAVNLIELYQTAELNDPQFQQVIANYRAVLERKPQAWALLRPSINVTANTFSNDQSISNSASTFGTSGDVSFNSHGYRLNFSQPLFRLDRYRALDQADSQIKQAATEIESARQDLMIRLAENYFATLAAQDNLEFANAEEESLERQLEQAEQRFEVGLIAITDVQEATAGYDQATAGKISAENEIDIAHERLREIVNEYSESLATLSDKMPLLNPEPASIDEWTETALENNLEIIAAKTATDISRQEIKVRGAGHAPTLDLIANHGFDASGGRFGGNSTHGTAVGLELTIPIYEGGSTSSRVREAVQLNEQSLHILEQSRRKTKRLTRTAYLSVISGISEVKAFKQALLSSETALEATQTGFEVGTRTAVDVVTAERTVQESRRNYSNARYDYLLDTLRLKQAAGSLSLEDLSYVSNWLE